MTDPFAAVPPVAPLAADCAALRDAIVERGLPPVWRLDPETARALNLEGNLLARAAWQPDLDALAVESADLAWPGVVPLRHYRPLGDGPHPRSDVTMVWMHGGGWVLGSLETADAICRSMVHLTGWEVVSVDYRVAPWHRFPAAFEDCRAAAAAVLERADRVVVAGDSAGANLAGAVARDPGLADRLAGQFLVYPATDPTLSAPSVGEFVEGPLLSGRDMAWFYAQYLGDRAATVAADPRVALTGPITTPVPPAVVLTVGHDPLRDEGIAYARALADAGTCRWIHAPDLHHGAFTQAGVLPSAWTRVEQACAALVTLVT